MRKYRAMTNGVEYFIFSGANVRYVKGLKFWDRLKIRLEKDGLSSFPKRELFTINSHIWSLGQKNLTFNRRKVDESKWRKNTINIHSPRTYIIVDLYRFYHIAK